MHRICTQSKTTEEVHPEEPHAAQGLVDRHLPGIRVFHLHPHPPQHRHLGYEGGLLFTFYIINYEIFSTVIIIIIIIINDVIFGLSYFFINK